MTSNTFDSKAAPNQSPASLSPMYWAGIVLAATTGLLHLWFGVVHGAPPLLVAGVGFVVGIAAVVLGVRRRDVVLLGIPFTAGQILLYFVAHTSDFAPLELGDKAVQAVLVAVLVGLYRRD